MENEILQQILNRLESMDNRLSGIEAEQKELRQEQKEMRQEIADLRDSTFSEMQGIQKELASMRDSQQIIIDMGKESINLMHEAKALIDENIQEQVALSVRVTELEKKVG